MYKYFSKYCHGYYLIQLIPPYVCKVDKLFPFYRWGTWYSSNSPQFKEPVKCPMLFPIYFPCTLVAIFSLFLHSLPLITAPEANPKSEIMEKINTKSNYQQMLYCIWQGNRLSCCNKETPNTMAQTKIEVCFLSHITVQGSGQFRVVHPGAQVHFSLPIF